MWKYVVFDLDDTLYLERDYVWSGFRAVANWAELYLGIPAQNGFAELCALYHEGIRGVTFNHWLAAHGLSNTFAPQLVQVYRMHHPSLEPFPGVVRLLEALRQEHYLGLVSDGYLEVQQLKLAALGLSHYFNAVVFSDRLGRDAWKPSTKPFATVLDLLGASAEESVYIADNPIKDFLGAKQIGMHTIRLICSGGEYAHLEPQTVHHYPHITVTSLADLAKLLAVQEHI